MFPKRTFGLFVSGLFMDWATCRMRIFFLEERLAGKGETIKVRRSSVLILWIFVPSLNSVKVDKTEALKWDDRPLQCS